MREMHLFDFHKRFKRRENESRYKTETQNVINSVCQNNNINNNSKTFPLIDNDEINFKEKNKNSESRNNHIDVNNYLNQNKNNSNNFRGTYMSQASSMSISGKNETDGFRSIHGKSSFKLKYALLEENYNNNNNLLPFKNKISKTKKSNSTILFQSPIKEANWAYINHTAKSKEMLNNNKEFSLKANRKSESQSNIHRIQNHIEQKEFQELDRISFAPITYQKQVSSRKNNMFRNSLFDYNQIKEVKKKVLLYSTQKEKDNKNSNLNEKSIYNNLNGSNNIDYYNNHNNYHFGKNNFNNIINNGFHAGVNSNDISGNRVCQIKRTSLLPNINMNHHGMKRSYNSNNYLNERNLNDNISRENREKNHEIMHEPRGKRNNYQPDDIVVFIKKPNGNKQANNISRHTQHKKSINLDVTKYKSNADIIQSLILP